MNRFTTALAASTILAASVLLASPAAASGRSDIAEVRAATATYHDVDTALADGFVPSSPCVPEMGFHYQRGVSANASDIDPTVPEILVYAPRPNGSLKLVAVEYAAWNDDAEVLGQEMDDPTAPFGPPFFTLHAWVWQGNPDGVFATHNPSVSCD